MNSFLNYSRGLDLLDAGEFKTLVVGNQDGKAFCAGANILMILMGAMQQQWDQIEGSIKRLQDLVMRAKYSKAPIITAPYGLTLGGGCEVAMHSSATIAGGELYMGLVEVGVGLIPGGGGCRFSHLRIFPLPLITTRFPTSPRRLKTLRWPKCRPPVKRPVTWLTSAVRTV